MSKLTEQRIQGLSAALITAGVAAFVVIVGLASVYFMTRGGSGSETGTGGDMVMNMSGRTLPDYAMAAGTNAQVAYRFSADRPDIMRWMVCYCGCGDHSGHKSALNCFVKENMREFDEHGANCEMCVDIALIAKSMTEEGRSLRDIRAFIDGKYAAIGPGTDTPLPPA